MGEDVKRSLPFNTTSPSAVPTHKLFSLSFRIVRIVLEGRGKTSESVL